LSEQYDIIRNYKPQGHYPGSLKGPNPDDDLESYYGWVYDNMPYKEKNILETVILPAFKIEEEQENKNSK
jgi:hypothetical protein